VGDTAKWVISVRNKGSAPLTHVSVTDPGVPACAKTFPGSLAPGAREPSYPCSKADVDKKFVNRARVRGRSSGKAHVRFWGGSASAKVEIIGLDVAMWCTSPVRVGAALACQYLAYVPDGDDPVNFHEDQAQSQVESAGGQVTSPPDLLASAPQDPAGGAFCGSSSHLCFLPPGSSIGFGPVSFYTVQAGDYRLPDHLLISSFNVPWSASCENGTAQCSGSSEAGSASAVKRARA